MPEEPLRESGPPVSSLPNPDPGRGRRLSRRRVAVGLVLLTLLVAGGTWLLGYEARTSRLQARVLSGYAADLSYQTAPGASDRVRFPAHGPFDQRLGYTGIPGFVARLEPRGFAITEQVRQSPALLAHLERGLYAPYAEKSQAGLAVFDCRREPVYAFHYPYRAFERFE